MKSISRRIEQLESQVADMRPAGLPNTTMQAVRFAILEDTEAVGLLRNAAMLEDCDLTLQSLADDCDLMDGITNDNKAEHVAAMRAEANGRIRSMIVERFGDEVASAVFGQ